MYRVVQHNHNPIIEHSITPKISLLLLYRQSLLPTPSWAIMKVCCLTDLLFYTFHIKGIIPCGVFYIWLLSFRIGVPNLPAACFSVNKVLLEYYHTQSLMYCLLLL